ncbi:MULTISPECIES: hypothetical protein [Streptomyces]|uniref:Uncharacterized protein n=1 Tax=Streptomyces clavifer TaxID=68188 RepID=A0ABS4VH98_9ACTN|nr:MULTISPECIES: hypothetical protein [Streptomyces]MBP2363250.1 hypothetical protein [Streptomyces clavifer]MDX2743212.1 hypothetical protein [Streptomyces sp. NRRL_B-2557]
MIRWEQDGAAIRPAHVGRHLVERGGTTAPDDPKGFLCFGRRIPEA